MPRRLMLLTVAAALLALSPARPDDNVAPEGFTALFNGKDLAGWWLRGDRQGTWGVEKGVLFTTGKGGGYLMTEKEFSDFDLRLEFKLPEKGNSGVGVRTPLADDAAYVGMEIQILDDVWHKANYKDLRNVQLCGSIYDVVPPSKDANKPIGEWNQMRIVAKGRQITVELNGEKIVDANLDDFKDHFEKHPGLKRDKGHLGLQCHSERIEFRNIFVKAL